MTHSSVHCFCIAGFHVKVTFLGDSQNSIALLPSFSTFAEKGIPNAEPLLFDLVVDDTLRPYPKERRTRIRKFDTGNGDTIVDELDNGGYQYIIKDIRGRECCLLQSDKLFRHCKAALNGSVRMRRYGLNNAMMLIFAYASCKHDTALVHASLVRQHGYGFAFIAKSGTGKSTQVSQWLKYLPDCDLMNDDNPVVRVIDGKAYVYGSPWSGKTPCYRNVKAPLGAVSRIDRAPSNSIERLKPVEAFTSLLPSLASMKWDEDIFDRVCSTAIKIVECTAIYTLHCLPDREAAEVCNRAVWETLKEKPA